MLTQCRECACFSAPNAFPREIPRVFRLFHNVLTARRLGGKSVSSCHSSFYGTGFSMMRKSPFRSVTKPLPDDGTGFYARLNGLFGTPDTSRGHDSGVFMVRLNVFSCPVIMFPQHRGMAFTGMCFNLKLLIAGTFIRLKGSGADSAYTRRAFITWLSGRCGI